MRTMILLLCSLFACSESVDTNPEPTRNAIDLSDRVRFAPLTVASEETLITLPAEVVTAPRGAISLSAPMDGLLTRVFVNAGQRLATGDPIADLEIPSREEDRVSEPILVTRVEQREAALATARRRVTLGLGSVVDVQEAERELTHAEEALATVRSRLQRARRLGLAEGPEGGWQWRSTQRGSIAKSALRVGMAVTPDQHLLELVDATVTEIRVALPERYLHRVDSETRAQFMPRGTRDWSDPLPENRRAAAIDPGTRTLDLFFRIAGTAPQPSGRTGRATIAIPTLAERYRVPRPSVTQIEGAHVVFRAEGDDPRLAQHVAVTVVGRVAEDLLIEAPDLSPEDRIAVTGVFLLKSIALLGEE